MKRGIIFLMLICIALIILGCGNETAVSPELNNGHQVTLAKAASSTNPVITFLAETTVGSSRLVRNKNGISMTLQTSGLTAGHPHTVWWVVFNEPGACENNPDPCGLTDLFDDDVKADVLYAAGNVIGGIGTGNFAAHLSEGDDSGSIASLFGLPAAEGLIDAETAEVHLIVRSHGPKIPGQVDDQINSFNGGCSGDDLAGGAVPVNVGECSDIQFSIHQ